MVDERFVDVIAAGCDAGIRYEERLEADMIAIPIGARVQRFATAAAPAYLARRGRPAHPRDLLSHACLRSQFPSGVRPPWEFERDGEVVRVDPTGPLLVSAGGATDLAVDAAIAGVGIIHLFEDWLAAAPGQRRPRAGAAAVVAELLRAVPLLPGPTPRARAAAGLRRFRQGRGPCRRCCNCPAAPIARVERGRSQCLAAAMMPWMASTTASGRSVCRVLCPASARERVSPRGTERANVS